MKFERIGVEPRLGRIGLAGFWKRGYAGFGADLSFIEMSKIMLFLGLIRLSRRKSPGLNSCDSANTTSLLLRRWLMSSLACGESMDLFECLCLNGDENDSKYEMKSLSFCISCNIIVGFIFSWRLLLFLVFELFFLLLIIVYFVHKNLITAVYLHRNDSVDDFIKLRSFIWNTFISISLNLFCEVPLFVHIRDFIFDVISNAIHSYFKRRMF